LSVNDFSASSPLAASAPVTPRSGIPDGRANTDETSAGRRRLPGGSRAIGAADAGGITSDENMARCAPLHLLGPSCARVRVLAILLCVLFTPFRARARALPTALVTL
jgi:hypothetical protein